MESLYVLEALRSAISENFDNRLTQERIDLIFAICANEKLSVHFRTQIRASFYYRFFYKNNIFFSPTKEDYVARLKYEMEALKRDVERIPHFIVKI